MTNIMESVAKNLKIKKKEFKNSYECLHMLKQLNKNIKSKNLSKNSNF